MTLFFRLVASIFLIIVLILYLAWRGGGFKGNGPLGWKLAKHVGLFVLIYFLLFFPVGGVFCAHPAPGCGYAALIITLVPTGIIYAIRAVFLKLRRNGLPSPRPLASVIGFPAEDVSNRASTPINAYTLKALLLSLVGPLLPFIASYGRAISLGLGILFSIAGIFLSAKSINQIKKTAERGKLLAITLLIVFVCYLGLSFYKYWHAFNCQSYNRSSIIDDVELAYGFNLCAFGDNFRLPLYFLVL